MREDAGAPLLPYNSMLFKELTLSYRGPLPAQLEAAQAEESLYGWWWRFLKASPDYPPGPAHRDDPVRSAVYDDFGDLGESFQEWWVARGRDLFQERGELPLIQLRDVIGDAAGPTGARALVLEVPLNISREGIIEQLNFVLDRFHVGDNLLRHQHSTARRRIFPRPRYRRDKLAVLLDVWKARHRDPQPTFWEIGRDLGIAPWLVPGADEDTKVASDMRKELGGKVERLYAQAEKLVHNAALGQFPRDDQKIRTEGDKRLMP